MCLLGWCRGRSGLLRVITLGINLSFDLLPLAPEPRPPRRGRTGAALRPSRPSASRNSPQQIVSRAAVQDRNSVLGALARKRGPVDEVQTKKKTRSRKGRKEYVITPESPPVSSFGFCPGRLPGGVVGWIPAGDQAQSSLGPQITQYDYRFAIELPPPVTDTPATDRQPPL